MLIHARSLLHVTIWCLVFTDGVPTRDDDLTLYSMMMIHMTWWHCYFTDLHLLFCCYTFTTMLMSFTVMMMMLPFTHGVPAPHLMFPRCAEFIVALPSDAMHTPWWYRLRTLPHCDARWRIWCCYGDVAFVRVYDLLPAFCTVFCWYNHLRYAFVTLIALPHIASTLFRVFTLLLRWCLHPVCCSW